MYSKTVLTTSCIICSFVLGRWGGGEGDALGNGSWLWGGVPESWKRDILGFNVTSSSSFSDSSESES